jgi:hypothetical protein
MENYAPTKMNIQARDDYSCQYCGTNKKPFTIDHVLPKSRDGLWQWDNLVCCCPECNAKKGNKTPQEANMPLRRTPRAPKPGSLAPPRLRGNLRSDRVPTEWILYIQRMPFMKALSGHEGADRGVVRSTRTGVKPALPPAEPPVEPDSDAAAQCPV